MLHRSAGLDPSGLSAIADLERRVVAADGGRLTLEHAMPRSRPGEVVEDLLWWEGGVLLGFCGLCSFGGDAALALLASGSDAGVHGFVVAEHLRGRGIGRAVLARVCSRLIADGVRRVSPEVDVADENALGLCTSLGLEPAAGEDHLTVPTSLVVPRPARSAPASLPPRR